ncbi:glycosyltransferase family 2 protein [Salinibacterium sp. dk2585]|nr:glycosyltransferase family 2 protein [Salinibacterium sp. dk2585]TXK56085.1 glycosyltransferase family 2 protein [Salinibacterium sp. dk5596]
MVLRVSVALCTHNGAAFVRAQVASILAQTVPVAEIVLSDDASSDDTVRIVTEEIERHEGDRPALTVLRNSPALGVVRNFEQALRQCTGDLVALCDQDDVWRLDRLEHVAAVFEERPELLLVHSDARLVRSDGIPFGDGLAATQRISARERRELTAGQSFDTLLRRSLVTGATVVLRRTLLDRALPVAPGWVHDEWLAIVAAVTGGTHFVEEQLLDYRQHSGNQIGVQQRGLSGRLARLITPREARNARLVERAAVLQERLQRLATEGHVSDSAAKAAADKLAHDRIRQTLPRTRVLRLLPVMGEAMTGRYSRFGRGGQDIARDILQQAR